MLTSLLQKRRKTACPYCYGELDINQVSFRCAGRGKPGLPACTAVEDPVRVQVLRDNAPVMPVVTARTPDGKPLLGQGGRPVPVLNRDRATCQACGGETAVRICPGCHSMLPRNISNDSPLFGLVGVRNSGKTVMLSVLHQELLRGVARRFNASIDNPGGSHGLAADLDRYAREMRSGGHALPPQTTVDRYRAPAVYEWNWTYKGRSASTIFSLFDNAGEAFASPEKAMDQHYLAAAGGVILLLDPFSFPENIDLPGSTPDNDLPESVLDAITYVLQTTGHVKRNRKIKVPLAVVITKVDAFYHQIPDGHPLRRPSSEQPFFDEEESLSVHDHIGGMIAQWGGDGLLRKFEQNYANFRFFGASALGAEPDYGMSTVNSRGVLPHRVTEPLLWLMADSGFLPKRG